MQFIPNNNMISMLRFAAGLSSLNFINTGGSSQNLYDNGKNKLPFYATSGSPQYWGVDKPFPYASAKENPAANDYTVPNPVGSSTVNFGITSKGWTATINITAFSNATVNSIYFTRGLYYSSSYNSEAVIFALKLDTPVELNAENNYTANFTFAIEF